jgi:hypothetical protein
VSDVYAGLLRDAFEVLDRHFAALPNRDPSRSLNEDRCELLRRVRAALDPLILDAAIPREDVAEIAHRIDALLATECLTTQSTVPHMYLPR